MQRVPILGVPIHAATKDVVLATFRAWLQEDAVGHAIATVNAEFLVAASHDLAFLTRLGRADLALADGSGVIWAAHVLARTPRPPFYGMKVRWQAFTSLVALAVAPHRVLDVLPEKLPGSDLAIDLCRVAADEGKSVFLLGGGPGVADGAGAKLLSLIPHLVVAGTYGGRADGSDDAAQRTAINASGAAFVLVAFSAQDQLAWMERNLTSLPGIHAAMGVGGTLDFLAGTRDPAHALGFAARQPPGWMRRSGLDWLWRLLTQPYRWRRVWSAVITFPRLVIASQLDRHTM